MIVHRILRPVRLNFFRGSVRGYASQAGIVAQTLFARCESCGSAFHESGDTKAPGHRNDIAKLLQEQESVRSKANEGFRELFDKLDEDKKKWLKEDAIKQSGLDVSKEAVDWNTSASDSIEKSKKDHKLKLKEKDLKAICTRCSSIHSHSHPEIVQPVEDKKDILGAIPSNAKLVHVMNAADFPASLDTSLANKRNVLWVVNFSDLIAQQDTFYERGAAFYEDQLHKLVGATPHNVICISAKREWNMNRLVEALGPENYLFGYTNTGKSSIAQYLARKFQGEGPSQVTHQRGLGKSPFPWLTQSPFTYELSGGKLLTDLPSLPESRGGIWGVIKPQLYRQVVEGMYQFKNSKGNFNVRRVVTNLQSHKFDVGGLMRICQDEKQYEGNPVHLIAWPLVPDAKQKFRRYSKEDALVKWASTPLEDLTDAQRAMLRNSFYVRSDKAHSFNEKGRSIHIGGGGTTLAIRGLGVIPMVLFGKVPEDGFELTLRVLDGLTVTKRASILKYMRDLEKDDKKKAKRDGRKTAHKKSKAK